MSTTVPYGIRLRPPTREKRSSSDAILRSSPLHTPHLNDKAKQWRQQCTAYCSLEPLPYHILIYTVGIPNQLTARHALQTKPKNDKLLESPIIVPYLTRLLLERRPSPRRCPDIDPPRPPNPFRRRTRGTTHKGTASGSTIGVGVSSTM